MKKILRSDLYRLFHQPSTYVILTVTFLIMLVNSLSLGIFLGNADWVSQLHTKLLENLAMVDAYQDTDMFATIISLFSMGADSLLTFISLNMKADLLYFIAAFVACFIALPRNSGYLKNLTPDFDRRVFFLSNLVILFFYSFTITLITVFSNTLASVICFKNLPLGDVNAFLQYACLTVLLVFTAGVVMSIIIEFFRKTSTGVILIFVYLAIGSGIVYTLLDMIFSSILGRDVRIELFTPAGAMSLLSIGDNETALISAIVVGIYLFMSVFYEMTLACKKDFI